MKKRVKQLIVIILFILIIMFIKHIIKTNHKVEYKISKYKITENFKTINKKHQYTIKITNKDKVYTYILNKNINKQKQIIKDIKTYKSKDINCIIPIYKNKKIENNIYCLNKKEQVSNYSLQNNKEYKNILKKAKKYNLPTINKTNKTTKYKKLSIYKDNINDDEVYTIWDYRGIYIVKNNNYQYKSILSNDIYDNVMSTIVNKYYVIFDNRSVNGIEKIYYYDLDKYKLKEFKPQEKISKTSYINGVYNNDIYVTDTKEKKQYKINVKKEKVEEISINNEYYLYRNNKEIILDKTSFFQDNQYFTNYKVESKKIESLDIKEDLNYYYYTKDNKFYSQIKGKKYNSKYLFELSNIDIWQVIDGNIVLISDGILYKYSDSEGLKKIVESNELKYNYENIYNYWKKG